MVDMTVIGVCSYAPPVHRWLRTLRDHFDGRCILYLTEPPAGVASALRSKYGVEVLSVNDSAHYWERKTRGFYCAQWRCVLDACRNRIRGGLVLRTDVWDVAFQDDPRKYVTADCSKILVSHENIAIATG